MFLHEELLESWIINQGVLVNNLTEFGSLVWHKIVIVIMVLCAVYLGALHASKLSLVYIVVFKWFSSWLLYTIHAPLGRSSCAVEDVSNLHLEQPFGKITLRDMLPLLPQDGTVRFAREYSTLAWHWCIPNSSEMCIAILLIKKAQWKNASLQDFASFSSLGHVPLNLFPCAFFLCRVRIRGPQATSAKSLVIFADVSIFLSMWVVKILIKSMLLGEKGHGFQKPEMKCGCGLWTNTCSWPQLE